MESTELVHQNSAALARVPAAAIETASTAVAAQMDATIRARYALAQLRPRDFDAVRLSLLKACERPKFAQGAIYKLPRGGKSIEGASIRFAEEAARAMGNIAVDTSIVHDDGEKRLVRVTVTDIEANIPYSQDVVVEKYVERKSLKPGEKAISSRTNSAGETVHRLPATEDDLLFKQAALTSKAVRTLILRVVPGDILEEAVALCKTIRGKADAKDPTEARRVLVDSFDAIGIKPADLRAYLGHDLDHMTPPERDELRSVYAAIRDGETTWTEIMATKQPVKTEAASAPGAVKTAEELAARRKAKKASAEQAAAPAPAAEPKRCEHCGVKDGDAHVEKCPNGEPPAPGSEG